jgi:hypothetical protein
VRVIRPLASAVVALVAALTIGLASSISAPAPASATTAVAMTDSYSSPPSLLSVFAAPFRLGMRVVDAIAQGLANAVEEIATPDPITIPAPHTGT